MMSKYFAFLLLLALTSFAVAQNTNARRNYRVLNVDHGGEGSGSGKGGSKGSKGGSMTAKGKGGAKGESSGKGTKKAAMHSKSSKKMKQVVDDMEDMVLGSMSM